MLRAVLRAPYVNLEARAVCAAVKLAVWGTCWSPCRRAVVRGGVCPRGHVHVRDDDGAEQSVGAGRTSPSCTAWPTCSASVSRLVRSVRSAVSVRSVRSELSVTVVELADVVTAQHEQGRAAAAGVGRVVGRSRQQAARRTHSRRSTLSCIGAEH